jgi:hypothetical protein
MNGLSNPIESPGLHMTSKTLSFNTSNARHFPFSVSVETILLVIDNTSLACGEKLIHPYAAFLYPE